MNILQDQQHGMELIDIKNAVKDVINLEQILKLILKIT